MRLSLQKIQVFWRLMRMDKPVGIVLLLWPTWWALWLAERHPPEWHPLLWMTLGVVVMRSLGCVINDICDARYDRYVKRTCQRPLAQDELSKKSACVLALILALCAFFIVLQFNLLVIGLSFVGLFMTLIYPLTKRFFPCPQLFLGLTFAWGIPMVYAALLNTVPIEAWCLYALAALWILIYDTEYAMVDREDDVKIGVRSSARLFGCYDIIVLGGFMGALILAWCGFAYWLSLPMGFYLGWMCMLMGLVYQLHLIWHRDQADCFRAFLANQWWGGLVWLVIILSV